MGSARRPHSPMNDSRFPVGVATIGQAPRPDMMADLRSVLGDARTIHEVGALDELQDQQILEMAPDEGDFPLVSRLRDGTVVELSRAAVIPLLQSALDRLATAGARIFVVLCTGEFPRFHAPGPILLPQKVLSSTVDALGVHKIGLLPPLAEQVGEVEARWEAAGYDPVVLPASPYGDDGLILNAGRELASASVEAVVLDCQAYRLRHREMLRAVLDCPILVPNGLIGRYLQELTA